MTKEQLLDIANKSYFKRSPELRLMYATADGNFFFPEKAHYGRAHAKASGFKLLMIENPAFAEKKEEEKPAKVVKEEPKAEEPKEEPKPAAKPKATRKRKTTKKKD